jgi:hypothetical protein
MERMFMKESADFRVRTEYGRLFLPPGLGRNLGSVIQVVVPVGSPIYKLIEWLSPHAPHFLFLGWRISRVFSKRELSHAKVLLLNLTRCFEPAGEQCGTKYADSGSCPLCGCGSKQITPLSLDLRKVPKGADFARTIAGEWIVSQRLADLIHDRDITGCEIRPIEFRRNYEDTPIDFTNTASGREMLRRAESVGIKPYTWDFMTWINQIEQFDIGEKARSEYIQQLEKRAQRARPLKSRWYQLVINDAEACVTEPTLFGVDPFDHDSQARYRCPESEEPGHVLGLNRLSQLWILEASWSGEDITCTSSFVGSRRGILRPRPLILISQRFYQILTENKIKGVAVEVVNLK